MSTVAPLRTTHVQPGGGRTLGAVAAEWTKLWSVRSTAWSLVAAAALVVSGGLVLGMSAAASAEAGHDVQSAPHLAAVGLQLALLALVAMTTLSVTSEYSSGTISTTLQGVPLRGRVLAAKAAVVGAVTFVAGVVLSAVGTVSVVSTMGEAGDIDGREVVLSMLGAGAYVALLSLLTLGLGTGAAQRGRHDHQRPAAVARDPADHAPRRGRLAAARRRLPPQCCRADPDDAGVDAVRRVGRGAGARRLGGGGGRGGLCRAADEGRVTRQSVSRRTQKL